MDPGGWSKKSVAPKVFDLIGDFEDEDYVGNTFCYSCGTYFMHSLQFFCYSCGNARSNIPTVESYDLEHFMALRQGWALRDEKTACCNRFPENCQCDVSVTLELAQQVLKDEVYSPNSDCAKCIHYMRFSCGSYKSAADDALTGHDTEAITTCRDFVWADSVNQID